MKTPPVPRIVQGMKKSEALNILGLQNGATEDEIKRAHRKKVIENHPDRFTDPQKKKEAEEKTKLINEARDVLQSGKWDPEYGPRTAGYGNPYAAPYSTYRPAQGRHAGTGSGASSGSGDPFDGFPFDFDYVWTSWDNVGTQGQRQQQYRTTQDAYNPFDPFGTGSSSANPFDSVFTQAPRKTAEEEAAEAKTRLNQSIANLVVKLAVLAICSLLGGVAVGMFIYVIGTILFAISREVQGCSSILVLPFIFFFGPMLAFFMPGFGSSIGAGLLVFFGISVAYDIGTLRRDAAAVNTTKEKASFGK